MNNFVTSQIRTFVPIMVGALVSWLTTRGFELDAETATGLIIALTGLLQGLYYFLARLLERQNPQFGLLLGVTSQPNYKENK